MVFDERCCGRHAGTFLLGTLLLEQRNSDEQSIFDPLTSIFKKFFPGK